MFHSFTGSGRRPRQVNLSGRITTNPFAANSQQPPTGSHSALATAQQTRLARQQERERIQAAVALQKIWRGYKSRSRLAAQWRTQWDSLEYAQQESIASDPHTDQSAAQVDILTLLVRFFDARNEGDVQRLRRFFDRHLFIIERRGYSFTGDPWPKAYLRLEDACLDGLERSSSTDALKLFEQALQFVGAQIPERTSSNAAKFYQALRRLAVVRTSLPIELALVPLQAICSSTVQAYQSFGLLILTIPNLLEQKDTDELSRNVNIKILSAAIAELLREDGNPLSLSTPQRGMATPSKASRSHFKDQTASLVWLLSHIIYLHRHAHGFGLAQQQGDEDTYIFVIATLLSAVGDYVDTDSTSKEIDSSLSKKSQSKIIDTFVTSQIASLVNQSSIGGLLSQMGLHSRHTENGKTALAQNDRSRILAGYILNLLRLFPRRGDEIRMWLYLGTPVMQDRYVQNDRASVVKYFWKATQETSVYTQILREPRAAIQLLRPRPATTTSMSAVTSTLHSRTQSPIDDQWRIILLFVELYIFVLKVMDDEEFFAGEDMSVSYNSSDVARTNSLRLDDVKNLTTFLKYLGFTMYYYTSDILGSTDEEMQKDISRLFKPNTAETTLDKFEQSSHVAGLQGLSLDYMKGLVTGLLRAIYERDSRRSFLPKGHWLLTSLFDMTNFIDAVVEEEERRNQVQEAEDRDDAGESDGYDSAHEVTPRLVGTGQSQRLQRLEQLKRQQRKASRRRYLQAVAPRLEILQNMPFLIPFATRVQIFRRFVHLDQLKRRGGTTDPELWRMSLLHGFDPHSVNPLERHHAQIRRGHEFEDAYEQFFDLGSNLKEPIHITFLDQFGAQEAGIDGGGVTKEFLTSVTSQAFGSRDGIRLFMENDKHLLFPNPSAIDEQRQIMRDAGVEENSLMWTRQIGELLQQYEFLGRVVGKCLYEGILVDIGFAGFFLLKWALTGGTGSAPKESGYRANINDLRDFDEELYQGLLKLKNYPGDVEDFSLNFTVTDTLSLPHSNHKPKSPATKTITRPLAPLGPDTPVTNANRLVYISYIVRHRLTSQPYHQTSAFLRGLGSLVPPAWLSMFNQTELQTLVGGAPAPIDVEDLRKNTIYGGLYVIGDDGLEHPSVRIFWEVMREMDDADRRKVLKFVTSTPRAPLLGFGTLTPKFSLRDSGGSEGWALETSDVADATTGRSVRTARTPHGGAGGNNERLPSTSTCVNLLKLPRYKTKAICRRKLLQAVNSGAGFDLS